MSRLNPVFFFSKDHSDIVDKIKTIFFISFDKYRCLLSHCMLECFRPFLSTLLHLTSAFVVDAVSEEQDIKNFDRISKSCCYENRKASFGLQSGRPKGPI